ncbi:MAG: acetyl-CoA carboxylase carboxyltransferase subunit [Sandaracinus sp.]|nr:acetyl-CoA carboxylase carboxyltransferase subunit [Sandaracinus sp.]MBJ70907.1 acetyl-CoA carboxylase carboxyltransferase subunit [Sandaracinus sp.]HJK92025.1 carboxyl transferase domain-containing protein [Polyangiaceae bacterium LLY-WYZ-15_(1-7)]HJL22074.1 carboxyl transferase domain-containing protein [Polyangiaceae bacterium LLY-WYZ-15_(1-7)]
MVPSVAHAHRYPVLPTKVDRKSETFTSNRDAALTALAEIGAALAKANEGGGEKYTKRHVERGKILPRDRIELLLDRDSWFLEIGALAGYGMSGETPGTAVVGGIGKVSGVECLLVASEATVKGGAITPTSMLKTGRLAEIAEQNRLVGVSLIESAGADLPNQDKIFVHGGAGFRSLTQRSEQRIPTVCLVFGSSTAGGAYLPGMSDYVVMVKEQAQVYLAGPPLVKMATGEETGHEELGGAQMHSSISGVSDYLAEDELDALRLGREIVAHLDWRKPARPTPRPVEAPVHDPEDLLGIASADIKTPFDQREVIARIVDGSRFSEFKPLYGQTLVCGWAHLHGFPIGILANNGTLFSESANKGAQFIQLCNQQNIPLLFLQNTTGFMVGKKYEQEGIIKNGAKLINAVSNSTVPAITIMTGASFGAGNYGMSGRAYKPRFLFTWPNHRIAVMGGKQLAGVLDIIQRQAAAKRGREVDEQKLEVMKAMTEKTIDKQSHALYATARLWDDGIIDPRDTRTVVALALSASYNAPVAGTTSWGVFRH